MSMLSPSGQWRSGYSPSRRRTLPSGKSSTFSQRFVGLTPKTVMDAGRKGSCADRSDLDLNRPTGLQNRFTAGHHRRRSYSMTEPMLVASWQRR